MAVVEGLRVHQRAWRDGLIWVVIFSACVGCDAHLAYAAPREVHMAIEHGKMTAALDQVPLQAVLDQLQQLTGIRYVLPLAEAAHTISVRVHAVPLVEALREMFAPLSYAVRTDADGNLLSVVILETHAAASHAAVPPPSPGTLEPMPMPPVNGESMPITPPRDTASMPIKPARESLKIYISR
jgi:hypothetical protein